MSQRFSDAELAAEFWRHNGDTALCSEGIRYGAFGRKLESEKFENERLGTLHRFATLPHAHEPEPKTVYVYDASGRCVGNFPKPDNWTE